MSNLPEQHGQHEPEGGVPSGAVERSGTHPVGSEPEPETPLSVTRGLPFSKDTVWEFLAAGVDSLDIGVYVDWRNAAEGFFESLAEAKEQATRTQGIPFGDGACIILPSGKTNYAYHLQYPEFHLYISDSPVPKNNTPNSFLSLNSFLLWKLFLPGALDQPKAVIQKYGGEILQLKPNRVDLCADFYISNRLTTQFLQESITSKNTYRRTAVEADEIETFYVGKHDSKTLLRIYDKGREVLKHGTKLWFRDIWGRSANDVWRFEYQLRRDTLKKFSINDVDTLIEALPALWEYLTGTWSSLRIRSENANISRCPLHPLWVDVQKAGKTFGDPVPLKRNLTKGNMPVEWYVKHIYGCLKGFAVRKRIANLEEALAALREDIPIHASTEDWDEAIRVASIKLGLEPDF